MARFIVHVVPRAVRTAVAGQHGDAVKIRIAAAPTDGAANDELIRFLAEQLRVSRNAIEITAGHTSRRKRVTIAGMETTTVFRLLEGG
jgi:uncharacterized protein